MHKDIIVVGAGISGIAAGYNLQKSCPNKSFAILEGRDSLGGTWDLFKYPGIRSDSDMHTLGFRFKPWIHKKSIADGPSILDYLNETVDEYDLRKKILFNQKVIASNWVSEKSVWELSIDNNGQQQSMTLTSYFYVAATIVMTSLTCQHFLIKMNLKVGLFILSFGMKAWTTQIKKL